MTLTNALSLFSLLAALSAPPAPVDVLLAHAAAAHGVDPALMRCVMYAESDGDPTALGAAGERGLLQIKPATGAFLAEHAGVEDYNLWLPAHNLWLGAYGLSRWPEWWTTYPQCKGEG